MENIMSEENDWDQMNNGDVVLGPIQRVTRIETIMLWGWTLSSKCRNDSSKW